MDNVPLSLLLTLNMMDLFVLPFFPLLTEKVSEISYPIIFVTPYAIKKHGKKKHIYNNFSSTPIVGINLSASNVIFLYLLKALEKPEVFLIFSGVQETFPTIN